ncbi:unnamed protein product [Triticum turgidum subsp. durum]|uniref:Uncharacterized protein n=1 Tax=Triticum turgidum subsp. durum TaxID=4567 RepID=A0A9R0QWR4_TRITD|nr:unnamed protein product [Triticum turgidum subsp. durum]
MDKKGVLTSRDVPKRVQASQLNAGSDQMTNISPAQYDKDVNDNENLPHSRAAECILAIYISEPHQFSVISPVSCSTTEACTAQYMYYYCEGSKIWTQQVQR